MLDTIPSEININIIAFVNKSDLLNLRLTSRRLRQETWQRFGSAFFSIVHFDFCIGSFASLQEIAQHDGLCLFVRELRVGQQWSCKNDACRALTTGHRLGHQGYKWTRESSGCIDVTASEMVASFCTALSERLSNCRAMCMRQGMHERPGERGSDALLSMNDAVHLLLFAVSGLPIISLRFESVSGLGCQPQELPRRVIDQSPAAPWADALTELRLDWEISPYQSDMVHIAAGVINRAKALRRLHLNLHQCDASAILSRLNETPEVSPLTHLVLTRFRVQEEQLSSFLRRFKDTLLYLHVSSITLDSGEGWAAILSYSRHSLLLLEHFTLCDARYMSSQWLSLCFFDSILDWTGVPASGRAEFVVKPVRTPQGVWRFWISGIRYQGRYNDMRNLLAGLEKCARVNSQHHENEAARAGGWKRQDLPVTLVIAGRLKADRFQAKKFDSIFDRPSDRVPRHDWPSST